MSDSPFPPNKRGDAPDAEKPADTSAKVAPGHHPNSRRNLMPPVRKGEVRNPTGRNGRTRAEIVADVMEESSESDPTKMKIEMVVRAQYRRALKGSDMAAKTLIEHYKGKPSESIDLSNSDGSLAPSADSADRLNTEQRTRELVVLLAKAQSNAGPGPDGNSTT